ncbi:cysteine desulfurase [Nostoc ellipsosporum NOK]|nr:cysteine desulfurase [Nostoc ellipsosporum NOK]
MPKLPIYMDYNATTPCDPRVVDALVPWLGLHFGNPASRAHSFGWEAAAAVDLARRQVAQLIGADESEIIFTSGATESNNLALKGVFERYHQKGKHLITFATEHKAVLDTCKHIERSGGDITILPVDSEGQPDLSALEKAIRPDTLLIAAMYANNETGVIFPVKEISEIARRHQVLFFCDGAQAIGKIPVAVNTDGIDLLSISAHKFYGPKGVGALYVRRRDPRVSLAPLIDGGGHEKGLRSGTLNVPGIVGLGKASAIALQEMEQDAARLALLRDHLEERLLQLPGTKQNGDKKKRLPHTTHISFGNTDAATILQQIGKSIALSTGSACSSADPEPSHVLLAMGLTREQAISSLRFSLGKYSTKEEVDYVVEELGKVEGLRVKG